MKRNPSESSRALAVRLAREAVEQKGEHVRVLDVAELLYITDYFVVVTTQTARQTRGLADALNAAAKSAQLPKGRIEGDYRSTWLLMDFGTVVVHILTPEAREFYALDELWSDAVEVSLDEAA